MAIQQRKHTAETKMKIMLGETGRKKEGKVLECELRESLLCVAECKSSSRIFQEQRNSTRRNKIRFSLCNSVQVFYNEHTVHVHVAV